MPLRILPPESASGLFCTVAVVVTVDRDELLTVVLAERICAEDAGVTREPAHLQLVVVCLGQYSERAVLGVVPVAGVT